MNFFNKYKIRIGVFILAVVFVAYPVFATAGSNEDPIVSLSYFNKRVAMINDVLIQEIKELENRIETLETMNLEISNSNYNVPKYKVVFVRKGDRISLNESTEIIIRSGEVYTIANIYGEGMADVTVGRDLKDNEKILKNHLLITPRTDGRGIRCESDSYVMIKGNYELLQ